MNERSQERGMQWHYYSSRWAKREGWQASTTHLPYPMDLGWPLQQLIGDLFVFKI